MDADDVREIANNTAINVELIGQRLPIELWLILVELPDVVVSVPGGLQRSCQPATTVVVRF